MAGTTAFDISPGESSYATATGGNVYFAPVNIGVKSKSDDYLKYGALAIAALLLIALVKKRR